MRNADDSVTGFATIYTYNPDGTSTFLIVQGPVQFASEAERNQNGVIARFSSTIFKAADGQPFGGTYRPASVTPAGLGDGEFVFFTRRTGEFRTNSRSVSIRAVSPLPSTEEYVRLLSGTWALNAVMRRNPELQSDPAYERYVSHVVRIQPSEIQPVWEPGQYVELPGGGLRLSEDSLRQFWRPTSNVLTFDVICETDCPPASHPFGPPYNKFAITYFARIWVDVQTGRAGYVTAAQIFGSDRTRAYWATNEPTSATITGGSSWTFDLFLDDDKIIGRGGIIVTHTIFPQAFHPGSEIVMTKIDPKTAPRGTKIY
jgi:hypothetical protein